MLDDVEELLGQPPVRRHRTAWLVLGIVLVAAVSTGLVLGLHGGHKHARASSSSTPGAIHDSPGAPLDPSTWNDLAGAIFRVVYRPGAQQ